MLAKLQIRNKIFDFSRPYLMGIINVTPDSFSDGGECFLPDRALQRIEQLIQDGADIIDIGAESTRPGSDFISADEEIERLEPILKKFKKRQDLILSLDTTKSQTAEFGLQNGVDIINDISGLTLDSKMAEVIAKYQAAVIIMHSKGTPKVMQQNPTYENVIEEITAFFKSAIKKGKDAGITKIILDPGIGFGKTVEHNLEIIKNLAQFKKLNYPILIGTSRKSFLGKITNSEVNDRLPETIASNIIALGNGANFLRVHDVREMKKACQIFEVI